MFLRHRFQVWLGPSFDLGIGGIFSRTCFLVLVWVDLREVQGVILNVLDFSVRGLFLEGIWL